MQKNIYNNITAVILAGGKNSRYNEKSKGLLEIDGVSFYNRAINLLKKVFDKIIIITNTPEILPDDEYPKYSDIIKNIGPIGGIHSALYNIKNQEAIFVTAIDMPFLNEDIIRTIVDYYYSTNPEILIPRIDSFIEPLNAIYKTNIYLKLDEFIKDSDNYAIRNFFKNVNVKYIDFENNSDIAKAFININTPEEFELIYNQKQL